MNFQEWERMAVLDNIINGPRRERETLARSYAVSADGCRIISEYWGDRAKKEERRLRLLEARISALREERDRLEREVEETREILRREKRKQEEE